MSWLVLNTATAAALALLVIGVGRWLKPAPAVMHALWLFVLLKLVTPPLFTIPVDVSWWHEPRATAPAAVATRNVADQLLAALRDPIVLPARVELAADVSWTWPQLALTAWGTGSLAMFAWLAIGLARGQCRLRTFGPVTPQLAREVAALAARLRVRVPQLRNDPDATSPYVWCFGAVRLVLPVRALAAATPKGRAAVLAHELAHLRRGDHWLAHAELLLAVVLWWHPLFWFARNRLRLWAELACDAWAVACVPDAAVDYATVLVNAVSRCDFAAPAPAVLAARPAARAAFERRLTMILTENVPCRASRAWWLPFTTLALALFTVPVAAQRGEQDPVRVQVRVNGKEVEELSAAERKALLQRLLRAEELAEEKAAEKAQRKAEPAEQDPIAPRSKPDKANKPSKTDKPSKAGEAGKADKADKAEKAEKADKPAQPNGKVKRRVSTHGSDPIVIDAAGRSVEEIQEMLRGALEEARVEIMDDEDLRELGVTDDVLRLLDDIGAGKGLESSSIDALVKSALRGCSKVVVKELQADEDLKKLGLTEHITELVNGLLKGDCTVVVLEDATRRAIDEAMVDVERELRGNEDLKKLGIDVDALLDSILRASGRDAAKPKVERRRSADETVEAEELPAPPKKERQERAVIR